jgi:hypothetical protein
MGVLSRQLALPSPDVAETPRKSQRASDLVGAVVGASNREAFGAWCNPDSSAALGVFYGLAPSVAAACM